MRPEAATALMPRAVAAHQRGDLAAAEREYRAVLAVEPGHADATHFLGLLLHQRGESAQGLSLMQHALALSPQNYQYRSNLAGVLNQLGKPGDAERLYKEALALKPDHRDSHINLGMLYAAAGDHPRALACFDAALEFAPGDYIAWLGRAQSLQQLARGQEALAAYRKAAAAAADDPEQLQLLGVALREAGEFEEAGRCHARALALAPDSPQAENGLGNVLAMGGDLAAAEQHYRRAIALKPDYAGAFHNLVDVARLTPTDTLWPTLTTLAERTAALPPESAIALHFTLGRVWEGQQDYPRAFRHFREGNRLKRAAINYDEAAQARFFADFIANYPAMAQRGLENDEERPVFIVGMPRSGTSLVEQILASHPAVYGAGETHALRNCLREELPPDAGDYQLPRQLATLDDAAFRRVAARYSRHLDELAPGALRITNKLPGNLVFLGLMHLLYPRARIIHCRRDPMDTCLSCYTKLFTTGHPFSYELGELGRFHRMYQQLMTGWQRLLPEGAVLEVVYEELVANFESGTRRLVGHCGLPWDDACLSFHTAARPVRTASLAQVRQPIYSSSVGRWKRYASELAPLKEALGDLDQRGGV